MEEWKDIEGYEGLYQVSSKGRVKSLDKKVRHSRNGEYLVTRKGKMLSLIDNGNGYLYVSLRSNGKRKNHYVHRIVAKAFLECNDESLVVDHIDRNKKNNSVDNLRFVTQKENVNHSSHLMRHEKRKCKKTNTGEKYIRIVKSHGKEVFRLYMRKYNVCKTFKRLDEAVNVRDEILGGGSNG